MGFADLVVALLDRDPSCHPSAAHALQHPFFAPFNPLQWLLRSLEVPAPAAGTPSTIMTVEEATMKQGTRAAAAQLPRNSNSRGVKESSDVLPLSATGRVRTHSSWFQGIEGLKASTLCLLPKSMLLQPGVTAPTARFTINADRLSSDKLGEDDCQTHSPPHLALLGQLDPSRVNTGRQGLAADLPHITDKSKKVAAGTDLVTRVYSAPSYLTGSTVGGRQNAAVESVAAVPSFRAMGAVMVEVAAGSGFRARDVISPKPVVSGAWERLGELADQLMPWDESDGDDILARSLAGQAGHTVGRRLLDPCSTSSAPSPGHTLQSPTRVTLTAKRYVFPHPSLLY